MHLRHQRRAQFLEDVDKMCTRPPIADDMLLSKFDLQDEVEHCHDLLHLRLRQPVQEIDIQLELHRPQILRIV